MSQTTLVRRIVESGRSVRIPVVGNSMSPAIREPAEVVVERAAFGSIVPGEVVAFAIGDELFVHRVVARTRSTLITSGDNQDLLDPPVFRRDFIGRITAVLTSDGVVALPGLRTRQIGDRPAAHDVHFWLVAASDREVAAIGQLTREWGISLHVLQRTGVGVSAMTLEQLQARIPASALRVGISSGATASASQLPDLLGQSSNRQLHFILGCGFGNFASATSRLIPPDIVQFHMRTTAPHIPQRSFETVASLIGTLVPFLCCSYANFQYQPETASSADFSEPAIVRRCLGPVR